MESDLEPRVEFDEDGDNGMVFNNIFIPEELIARIFTHYMDAKGLLNCQLVCKQWNMIIADNKVWRKKAIMRTHRQLPLDELHDWKYYYALFTISKLGKNLIKNHSGAERTRNWAVTQNLGDGWKIEIPPDYGVPKLPEESEFGESQYCFATSYGSCQMIQVIDLLKEGFSANVLDDLKPAIEISEWYSCRYDCPALYTLTIQLKDFNNKILDMFQFEDILKDERQNVWFKVEHTFTNYRRGLRKIHFIHGGRDKRFWKGHYGSKMARATVKLNI